MKRSGAQDLRMRRLAREPGLRSQGSCAQYEKPLIPSDRPKAELTEDRSFHRRLRQPKPKLPPKVTFGTISTKILYLNINTHIHGIF